MEQIFKNLGIKATNNEIEELKIFKDLLLKYNDMFNLTAIKEERDIYIKHFADSVIFIDNFIDNSSVLDVGAGGGFPSIPLKILKKDLNFTLLDATGKKCEFLNTVINTLNLTGINVVNARAEELAFNENYREKYDYVVARAVAKLNVLCEYCIPFLKIGGKLIAYKSAEAVNEIKEAENAVKILGGKIIEIQKKELFNNERCAVIIEKIKSTDVKYPRANGKIKKKPL